MMSESSKASPLRFQKLEVTYDSVSPYLFLIGTLVNPAPFIGKFVLLMYFAILKRYECCWFYVITTDETTILRENIRSHLKLSSLS